MQRSIVVDTHVLIWMVADEARLSTPARVALAAAETRFVSAVSFWEVAMLSAKGRIEIDRPVATWTNDALAAGNLTELPLRADVAAAAGVLHDFHGDPADRMIVASAVSIGADLVTKDGTIRSWAHESGAVTCIW